jgi:hypothetical protein
VSLERRITVQWGLDLPRVGTMNARLRVERGTELSTAFVDGFLKTMLFWCTVISTFLRIGEVVDIELIVKRGVP